MNSHEACSLLESFDLISESGTIICPADFAFLRLVFTEVQCLIPSEQLGSTAPIRRKEGYANDVRLVDRAFLTWTEVSDEMEFGEGVETAIYVTPIDSLQFIVTYSYEGVVKLTR